MEFGARFSDTISDTKVLILMPLPQSTSYDIFNETDLSSLVVYCLQLTVTSNSILNRFFRHDISIRVLVSDRPSHQLTSSKFRDFEKKLPTFPRREQRSTFSHT